MKTSVLLVIACLLLACSDPVRNYSVRGRVVEQSADGSSLVVDHEDIPDYMGAMRMTLPLQDPAAAKGIEPGAVIRFDLAVQGSRASIVRLETLPSDTQLELAGDPHGG